MIEASACHTEQTVPEYATQWPRCQERPGIWHQGPTPGWGPCDLGAKDNTHQKMQQWEEGTINRSSHCCLPDGAFSITIQAVTQADPHSG
jgi:hypothetical protein